MAKKDEPYIKRVIYFIDDKEVSKEEAVTHVNKLWDTLRERRKKVS